MQDYLEKIIKENYIIKKNCKEILLIGDLKDYRERMSKNFIHFLDYIKDKSQKYNLIYYGTGIPGFNNNFTLNEVINSFCLQKDPIVWVCDIRGPSMTKNINEYNGIKIYDYEDVLGKVKQIIYDINTGGFDYVLYKADWPEAQQIKDKCYNVKFIQYDHYIDESIFMNYNLEKMYDVLCYGSVDYGCYPLRKRLFNLLKKTKDINTYFLEHPNYGSKKKHNIIDDNLSKLINKSKLTIVTPSKYNILLKKYIEAPLSMSCMVGQTPKYNGGKFKECIVEINMESTDDEIINNIKYYLKNDEERIDMIKKANKIVCENYTYKSGLLYIENILDDITNLR